MAATNVARKNESEAFRKDCQNAYRRLGGLEWLIKTMDKDHATRVKFVTLLAQMANKEIEQKVRIEGSMEHKIFGFVPEGAERILADIKTAIGPAEVDFFDIPKPDLPKEYALPMEAGPDGAFQVGDE